MKLLNILHIYFLLLTPFIVGKVHAQVYPFQQYTVEDGLSQNQVLAICQDEKGYMWFGTNNGGISIFDGSGFKKINLSNSPIGNTVLSIEQNDKKTFVGSSEGFSIYDNGNWQHFTTENNLPHNRVYRIYTDANSQTWIGTQNGLAKYVNGTITKVDIHEKLSQDLIYSIYEDSEGNLWFGTLKNGAFKYDGNIVEQYSIEQGLSHNFVETIIEDSDGKVWLGTLAGFSRLDSDTITRVLVKEDEYQITVTSSINLNKGKTWFGTQAGVAILDNGKFTRIDASNGLPSINIFTLFKDIEGNIWMGTNGQGVIKYRNNAEYMETYRKESGLPHNDIKSIYEDKAGNYWFGSSGNVSKMDKKGEVEVIGYFPNDKSATILECYSIEQDYQGNMLFGTYSKGLNIMKNGVFERYNMENGLSSNNIYDINLIEDGAIWLATSNGVNIMEEDSFYLLEGINEEVWCVYENNPNEYWIGFEKGLAILKDGKLKFYNESNGFTDSRVRTIVKDKKGNFWFATNEGIFNYNSKEFKQIGLENGLSDIGIYFVLADNLGSLWAGTNKGVDKIDLNHYYSTGQIKLRHYGKTEGFLGVECNLNACLEDSKGNIWFGTIDGAIKYTPRLDVMNGKEPQTHITNIRYEFDDHDWTEFSSGIDSITNLPINLELPHDKSHLTFDFIGISLTVPEKVRYKYILEPLDKDWTKPTQQNEAVYSHIPPGNYTFKVKAMNNDGVWNKESVDFSFTILPPWYQTWWFYTLCVLLIGGSIYTYITIRTKALQRQKKVLEDQVNQRTKQLREEKEKVEEINQEVIGKNMIIQAKNKDIMDSINYAKRIQDAMLPAQQIIDDSFNDAFVLFKPKDVVSGDFYWARKVGNKILFAAADCTGHGVPGAFVSIVGTTGLNRAINEYGLSSPADILDQLHEIVSQTFMHQGKEEVKDGMDIALCSLNMETLELEYAGANNPLYIVRDGKVMETKANKQPIGGTHIERVPFTNHVFKLQDEDAVYIFSDGYADQFGGPIGKKFKYRPFRDLIISMQDKPLAVQQTILNKEFEDWRGEHEQIDDVCVIGIKI